MLGGSVKTRQKRSITRNVLLLLFLFGVVPLALVGSTLLYANYRQQETQAMALQEQKAIRVASGLSNDVDRTVEEISLLSLTLYPGSPDLMANKQAMLQILNYRPDFDFVCITDEKGRELSIISRYYTYLPADLGSQAGSSDFKTVLSGHTAISSVVHSEFSNTPYINISVPLKDTQGKVRGMLQTSVNVSTLWKQVSRYKVGTDNIAYIVDGNGVLLASQDMSTVLSSRNLSDMAIVASLIRGQTGGQHYTGYNGSEVIGSGAIISATGWAVIVEVPVSAAFRQTYILSTVLGGGFLVTIFLAAFLGISFSWKRIVEPIKYLEKQASLLASHSLPGVIAVDSNDEFGQLADAFNTMALRIQEHQMHLVQMASELADKNQALQEEMQIRETAQRELAASEEKYAKAFRYSADIIGLVDLPTRRYLEVSEAFYRILGYKETDVIGRTSEDFGLWANLAERDYIYRQLSLCNSAHNVETSWFTCDRKVKVGITSAEVVEIGDCRYVIYVWHDISERKAAEKALQRAHDQLEARVEKRTLDLSAANDELYAINQELSDTLDTLRLAQSELIKSEKLASLGSLVAGVAHEINTPLGTAITAITHCESMMTSFRDLFDSRKATVNDFNHFLENVATSVEMVSSNLRRAAELIVSFKAVAVDQSNEIKRTFNVGSYLQDILRSLHPRLKKTSHTVRIECPPDLTIDSYPGAFAQIITNFIMNSLMHAFDETTSGKIDITVSAGNNEVCIVYADNGKGMDSATLDRVFDPFFTTKRAAGGTGLGLNIVYNIVTLQLKGTINCRSAPGAGTVFEIRLPA